MAQDNIGLNQFYGESDRDKRLIYMVSVILKTDKLPEDSTPAIVVARQHPTLTPTVTTNPAVQRVAQEAQGKHSINDCIISACIQEQNSISDDQSGTGAV